MKAQIQIKCLDIDVAMEPNDDGTVTIRAPLNLAGYYAMSPKVFNLDTGKRYSISLRGQRGDREFDCVLTEIDDPAVERHV